MNELINRIKTIKDEMEKELKSTDENLIDYAILECEILDAEYFLNNPNKEAVQFVQSQTTSKRIYEAIISYSENLIK